MRSCSMPRAFLSVAHASMDAEDGAHVIHLNYPYLEALTTMKNWICTTSVLVLALLIGAVAAHARTKDKCFRVVCRGSSGECISLGGGHGITASIPGVADVTQIPCPQLSIGTPNTWYGSVFIHDPSNPSMGLGYLNTDVQYCASTSDAAITTYDDSPQFPDYATWLSAQQ